MISRIQSAHNENAATGPSLACTLNGISPSALVVVFVAVSNAVSVLNVRDDLLVDAEIAKQFNWVAGSERIEHWYFKNHGGGNRTFTANYSATGAFRAIVAIEYKGADCIAPLGPTANNNGSSAAPSSGAIVPPSDNYLLVGSANGTDPAAAAPFANVFSETTTGSSTEDLVQAAAGSQAAGWTMTSGIWGAIISSYAPLAVKPIRRIMAPQQRMLA